ncbi:MAG: NAD-binding protein [Planctomycetales bacterium]
MDSPLRRLRAGVCFLLAVCLTGVLGYRAAGWSWLDATYMVVITVSTVGFAEIGEMNPGMRLFTILLIIFGITAMTYTMGGFLQMLTEGEINRALGERRMTTAMKRLSGHVIVCGYGRMGAILAGELHRRKRDFVVIDREPDRIREAEAEQYLVLTGDATEEEVLCEAGVERSKSLVTTLPNDAENVFITLTARNLNHDLKIIARGELPSTEKKLYQAGANRVVLPAAIGAMRMANMITMPSSMELIEQVSGLSSLQLQVDRVDVAMNELWVPKDSTLVGQTVVKAAIRSRHGLIVVAVKPASTGKLVFNPDNDLVFAEHDVVVVMGGKDTIAEFALQCRLKSEAR